MRKLFSVSICLILLASFAAEARALEIQVAPSTINKQSQGGSFSIHTDVPFSLYTRDGVLVSVTVNGEGLSFGAKSDSCGNLVIKANLDTVKEMVAPPTATVTVTADFVVTGNSETASETITVIDVSGKR